MAGACQSPRPIFRISETPHKRIFFFATKSCSFTWNHKVCNFLYCLVVQLIRKRLIWAWTWCKLLKKVLLNLNFVYVYLIFLFLFDLLTIPGAGSLCGYVEDNVALSQFTLGRMSKMAHTVSIRYSLTALWPCEGL